jgi:hypothetical protein
VKIIKREICDMKYRILIITIVLLLTSLILNNCTARQNVEVEQIPTSPNAYPGPDDVYHYEYDSRDESGYPISGNQFVQSEDIYQEVIEIPKPSPDTGVVIGKLVMALTNEPYLAPGLYLGRSLNSKDEIEGIPSVLTVSTDTAPKANQSIDGSFVFKDVEPNNYGLFVWSPLSLILVIDNETSHHIEVDVRPGEITDLGTIMIP